MCRSKNGRRTGGRDLAPEISAHLPEALFQALDGSRQALPTMFWAPENDEQTLATMFWRLEIARQALCIGVGSQNIARGVCAAIDGLGHDDAHAGAVAGDRKQGHQRGFSKNGLAPGRN